MICPQGFFEYLYIIGLRKKISERGVFDFLLGVIGTWVDDDDDMGEVDGDNGHAKDDLHDEDDDCKYSDNDEEDYG